MQEIKHSLWIWNDEYYDNHIVRIILQLSMKCKGSEIIFQCYLRDNTSLQDDVYMENSLNKLIYIPFVLLNRYLFYH